MTDDLWDGVEDAEQAVDVDTDTDAMPEVDPQELAFRFRDALEASRLAGFVAGFVPLYLGLVIVVLLPGLVALGTALLALTTVELGMSLADIRAGGDRLKIYAKADSKFIVVGISVGSILGALTVALGSTIALVGGLL